MTCRAEDGNFYSFSQADVVGCYCMQRLAALTEEHGLWGGPEFMMKQGVRDVCADFAWTYVEQSTVSALTAGATVVINEALKAAIQFLGDLERNKTVTQRTVSVMLNIFFCLFMNTAVVIVLVNAQFDGGIMESLGFMQSLGKDGESDYTTVWCVGGGGHPFPVRAPPPPPQPPTPSARPPPPIRPPDCPLDATYRTPPPPT